MLGTLPVNIAQMKPNRLNDEFLRFQRAISPQRLEAYRSSPSDTELELLSTYFWNIRLCESFYPALHNVEVSLRNNFYESISKLLDQDWLENLESGILEPEEVKSVKSAIGSLKRKKQVISRGNIVSELNLGFWVSLSYVRYEGKDKLYPRIFKDTEFLPHLPRRKRTRSTLSNIFTSIRKLRNKVFHHDSIWNKINLNQEYENILDVIEWISPILYKITKNISRFPSVYNEKSSTYAESLKSMIENEKSQKIEPISTDL